MRQEKRQNDANAVNYPGLTPYDYHIEIEALQKEQQEKINSLNKEEREKAEALGREANVKRAMLAQEIARERVREEEKASEAVIRASGEGFIQRLALSSRPTPGRVAEYQQDHRDTTELIIRHGAEEYAVWREQRKKDQDIASEREGMQWDVDAELGKRRWAAQQPRGYATIAAGERRDYELRLREMKDSSGTFLYDDDQVKNLMKRWDAVKGDERTKSLKDMMEDMQDKIDLGSGITDRWTLMRKQTRSRVWGGEQS